MGFSLGANPPRRIRATLGNGNGAGLCSGTSETSDDGQGGSDGAAGESGGTGTGSGAPICTPGDTRICTGPGACVGGQFCDEDGRWSACDCGELGGVAGAGGSTDSATGGSGGLAVDVCAAGLVQCGDLCVDLSSDPSHCGTCDTPCSSGTTCYEGQCAMACTVPAETACGISCVDLSSDPANCGGCGMLCVAGQVCLDGVCGCPDKLTACNGVCVDTLIDPSNCGTCGNVCAAGTCVDGSCQAGT